MTLYVRAKVQHLIFKSGLMLSLIERRTGTKKKIKVGHNCKVQVLAADQLSKQKIYTCVILSCVHVHIDTYRLFQLARSNRKKKKKRKERKSIFNSKKSSEKSAGAWCSGAHYSCVPLIAN
jgi:hypothetical protein